jgi:hypothetical protein
MSNPARVHHISLVVLLICALIGQLITPAWAHAARAASMPTNALCIGGVGALTDNSSRSVTSETRRAYETWLSAQDTIGKSLSNGPEQPSDTAGSHAHCPMCGGQAPMILGDMLLRCSEPGAVHETCVDRLIITALAGTQRLRPWAHAPPKHQPL